MILRVAFSLLIVGFVQLLCILCGGVKFLGMRSKMACFQWGQFSSGNVLILYLFNSLAPGGFENIFQNVFFKLISWIDTLSNSCEIALRSMPQNPSDDKSTLVQVMAWCRQAASHYLSQCCPKSLSPYGVTRPQWVKQSCIYIGRENSTLIHLLRIV